MYVTAAFPAALLFMPRVRSAEPMTATPMPPAVVAAPGWTLAWADEFTGPANTGVDTTKWIHDLGTSYPGGAANWGTGEIETMTNSTANVHLDGRGHLAITPIRDASGAWTSGRIETRRTDFAPPLGGVLAVEASIQLPNVNSENGVGYWPAFWMLGGPFRGTYTDWPNVGEIDIAESISGRPSIFGTLHCGQLPGGSCKEPNGLSSGQTSCIGCAGHFRVYRVEWDARVSPRQIRWYRDGVNYFSVKQNQVSPADWAAATNHGYMIILNVAIGGGFPGTPTARTLSGMSMVVDYVRVFRK